MNDNYDDNDNADDDNNYNNDNNYSSNIDKYSTSRTITFHRFYTRGICLHKGLIIYQILYCGLPGYIEIYANDLICKYILHNMILRKYNKREKKKKK